MKPHGGMRRKNAKTPKRIACVGQNSLVSKIIENGADDRTACADEIGQFLLRDVDVEFKAVGAFSTVVARQIQKRFRHSFPDFIKKETFKLPLQKFLTSGKGLNHAPGQGGAAGEKRLKIARRDAVEPRGSLGGRGLLSLILMIRRRSEQLPFRHQGRREFSSLPVDARELHMAVDDQKKAVARFSLEINRLLVVKFNHR